MLNYAQYFLDIVIVDSTYKRNRFNMVLINILGVNNYGKNVMLAFGLASDETISTYDWIFKNLKKAWKKDPLNFISDECASILNGLKNNFNSRCIVCGWHIQKNIISHLSGVNKKNISLYQRAISLPFVTKEEKYKQILTDLQNSQDLSDTQKEYIKKKVETENLWAKWLLKNKYAGGISTTSRVESLHATQKKYLNSSSSLQKVFKCFQTIEKLQIEKFQEEFQRHKSSSKLHLSDIKALEQIKDHVPEYVHKKLLPKFCKALNYSKEKLTHDSW